MPYVHVVNDEIGPRPMPGYATYILTIGILPCLVSHIATIYYVFREARHGNVHK